MPAAF